MRKFLFVLAVMVLGLATVFFQDQVTGEASTSDKVNKLSSEKDEADADKGKLDNKWKLKYKENFGEDLEINNGAWVRDDYGGDSPWNVNGEIDEDGEFFHVKGGKDFERHLDSFWMMRKREAFGEDGWLTVELAARDYKKDGQPNKPVLFNNVTLPDGNKAAKIDEKGHGGGALIRSTEPLPPEYRIEYTLKTVDFGGMRDGSFKYDGKVNGYDLKGPKTTFPWKAGGDFSGPSDPSNPNFSGVRKENGFYFLSIVDYPDPAPHNNIFIHSHRKVNMDAYNVNGLWSDMYSVCNPESGDLYNYNSSLSTRNGINALFMNGDKFKDSDMPYTDFLIETECGSHEGSIVSAAEIQPELMPNEDYEFAIERDESGYTMEMSGNFLHAGYKTLRYQRDFVQDGAPIWHYNNTPDEYDGQYNRSWENGDYTIEDLWPDQSAYPDYFIIGDPHLTHYEGSATVDDIRLYVPETISAEYMKTRVWQLDKAGEIDNDRTTRSLKMHLTAIEHFEKNDAKEKVIKHVKGLKTLLNHQKNNNFITNKAFNILNNNADSLMKGVK